MINDAEAIDNLNGLDFRMWDYTASHDRLTVSLDRTGSGDMLTFALCERLHIENQGKIGAATLIKGDGILIFKANGIEIECQEICRFEGSGKNIWCMNFLNRSGFVCKKIDANIS